MLIFIMLNMIPFNAEIKGCPSFVPKKSKACLVPMHPILGCTESEKSSKKLPITVREINKLLCPVGLLAHKLIKQIGHSLLLS